MNQCKFREGQDVWIISGRYKIGFSIKQYVFEKEMKHGLYLIREKDGEGEFAIEPYLVFVSEKDAHDSLVSKFTFWLERENKRYEESVRETEP